MAEVVATPEGRESIYTACLQAASDGLLLDKKQSALIVYNEKAGDGWIKVAKYMPMYQGLLHLALNSGAISRFLCEIVRQKDRFGVNMTALCPIHHEFPEDDPFADRGDIRGVYFVAQFKDGAWSGPVVLNVQQVEAIRARSKTGKSGPWATDWEEMAKKTAIRRACKTLPRSSVDLNQFRQAAERLDQFYDPVAPAIDGAAPQRKQLQAAALLGGGETTAPTASAAAATPAQEPKAQDDWGRDRDDEDDKGGDPPV